MGVFNFSTDVASGAVGKSPVDFPIWDSASFIKACEWAAGPTIRSLQLQLYVSLAVVIILLVVVCWVHRDRLSRVFKKGGGVPSREGVKRGDGEGESIEKTE